MSESLNRTRIPIEGMACRACAKRVRKTLERMPGVNAAEVDLKGELATVSYDPARADEVAMAERIRAAGFRPGTGSPE